MVKSVVLLGLKIAMGQQGQTATWQHNLEARLPGEHWQQNAYVVIATGPNLLKLHGVVIDPTQDSGEGTWTWVTTEYARAQAIMSVLHNTDKVSGWLFFRERDYPM